MKSGQRETFEKKRENELDLNQVAENVFVSLSKSDKLNEEYDAQMAITDNIQNQLLCILCDKTFRCRNDLQNHILYHPKMTYYPCFYCDKLFSKKSDVVYHITSHRNE